MNAKDHKVVLNVLSGDRMRTTGSVLSFFNDPFTMSVRHLENGAEYEFLSSLKYPETDLLLCIFP